MRTYTGGTLYKECVLTEEKNFVVDNLTNALANNWSSIRSSASDGAVPFGNVQYQKIKLNMKLKLICNETFVTKNPSDTYNYLFLAQTIYNDDDSVSRRDFYFFFVKKCTWLSQNCIEVELKLDTLNTYHTRLSSGIGVNAKSHTLRRHKDRWSVYEVAQGQITLAPKVDFYSEGISCLKYKAIGSDLKLNDSATGFNNNWYLVYKNNAELDSNSDLSKAVECWLCSEDSQTIGASSLVAERNIIAIAYNNFQTIEPDSAWWHCIYLTYEDNGPSTFTFIHYENNVRIVDGSVTLDAQNNYSLIVYWESNGEMKIATYNEKGAKSYEYNFPNATNIESYTWSAYRTFVQLRALATTYPFILKDIDEKTTYVRVGAGHPEFRTRRFDSIDRSDPTLIKVIKLPYCPSNIGADILANWRTGLLKVADVTSAYNRTITCSISSGYHPFYNLRTRTLSNSAFDNNDARNMSYETKLWHSDYFTPKFVYDSFALDFRLETQDAFEIQQINFSKFIFDFSMTSTINSRFMFTFNFFSQNEQTYATDYPNIVVVARNNEMPIFNQQYINYLRAGYNYDVKSKTRTEAVTWANVGLGISAGAIAGATGGTFFGPAGASVGAIAGAVVGGISSIINAIKTTVDAEENFSRKQEQLKQQATQIYGSDDVDLMQKYTGNRAILMQYKVSPKMEQLLYNLFYYYGYVSDEYGNPFTKGWATSRNNFNFLQCELVFNTQWGDNEIMEDITNRYKAGATIFHKTTSGSNTNFYDFEQNLENWELSIINELQ